MPLVYLYIMKLNFTIKTKEKRAPKNHEEIARIFKEATKDHEIWRGTKQDSKPILPQSSNQDFLI